MQTTYWQSKLPYEMMHLDRRSWVFLAGLAGALFACISPLSI